MKISFQIALSSAAIIAALGLVYIAGKDGASRYDKESVVVITEENKNNQPIIKREVSIYNLSKSLRSIEKTHGYKSEEVKIKTNLFGYLEHVDGVDIECNASLCTMAVKPLDGDIKNRVVATMVLISAGVKDDDIKRMGYKVRKTPITVINASGLTKIVLDKINKNQ